MNMITAYMTIAQHTNSLASQLLNEQAAKICLSPPFLNLSNTDVVSLFRSI